MKISIDVGFLLNVDWALVLQIRLRIDSPFGKSKQRGKVIANNLIVTILILSDLSDASKFGDFLFLNKGRTISHNKLSFAVSNSHDSLFVLSGNLNDQILIFWIDAGRYG